MHIFTKVSSIIDFIRNTYIVLNWPFYTSPKETLRILELSECRIKCPHCGRIAFWRGCDTPPTKCYCGCGESFLK